MVNMDEVRELRLKNKLTQLDMAIKTGVTLNTYRNWEQGANEPSDENLIKLKQVFCNLKKGGKDEN